MAGITLPDDLKDSLKLLDAGGAESLLVGHSAVGRHGSPRYIASISMRVSVDVMMGTVTLQAGGQDR